MKSYLPGSNVNILPDMEKGLVSIVVPVYNTAKYLDRCLESITSQTYRILEDSPLPEVAYFLEHFLPGFSLTLDELQ